MTSARTTASPGNTPSDDLLLTTAVALRSEVEELLDEVGIRPLLTEIGEAHPTGSYQLDLMVWPDLDISLVAPNLTRQRFFGLGHALCDRLEATDLFYRDTRVHAVAQRPRGLYWGLVFPTEKRPQWKLDLWVVEAAYWAESQRYVDGILAKMTPQKRLAILRLKSQVHQRPAYPGRYSSREIYRAVLDHGIESVEAFDAYLLAADIEP